MAVSSSIPGLRHCPSAREASPRFLEWQNIHAEASEWHCPRFNMHGEVPKGFFKDGLLVECAIVHRMLALLLLLKPAMRREHGSMTVLRYTRTLRLD